MTDQELTATNEHPFREIPPGRALRRAQLIVYAPLFLAMTVMLLAGFRLGLSPDVFQGSVEDRYAPAVLVAAAFLGIWLAVAISAHPDKVKLARWLLGCGMSLILGLTLGSWP